MAEAVARQDASDVIQPVSAGLSPLGHIERMTIHTLACNGYSSKGLRSKAVTAQILRSAELLVNMSGGPNSVLEAGIFPDGLKVEEWRVQDPYGADESIYQKILDDIVERVSGLADRLREQRER
jgi:protein-tyrosine-phosphatase